VTVSDYNARLPLTVHRDCLTRSRNTRANSHSYLYAFCLLLP